MAPPRILLYSHDSYGLGHFRRNLTLAQSFVRAFPGASALLVTGNPCCSLFDEEDGIDFVKLPSVGKDDEGNYRPRSLVGSLNDVLRMRSRLLLEAYRAYAPDLILVDHRVDGLGGEALPMLEEAERDGVPRVLGVRDVIDAPERVAQEWRGASTAAASLYDALAVYGMREVHDPVVDHPGLSVVADRARFLGYVVRESPPADEFDSPVREVLVTVGGGEDGSRRVETYLEALKSERAPWRSTVVLGPMFDAREARRLRREHAGLRVDFRRFHADLPRLLRQADLVLGMAGYNTCAEVLACGTPTVLWPRSAPRHEQLLRARRFADLGWARCVEDPDPASLFQTLHATLQDPPHPTLEPDLGGTAGAVDLFGELLGLEVGRSASFPALSRRRAIS